MALVCAWSDTFPLKTSNIQWRRCKWTGSSCKSDILSVEAQLMIKVSAAEVWCCCCGSCSHCVVSVFSRLFPRTLRSRWFITSPPCSSSVSPTAPTLWGLAPSWCCCMTRQISCWRYNTHGLRPTAQLPMRKEETQNVSVYSRAVKCFLQLIKCITQRWRKELKTAIVYLWAFPACSLLISSWSEPSCRGTWWWMVEQSLRQ